VTLETWANTINASDKLVPVDVNITLYDIKQTIIDLYAEYPCARCGDAGNCSNYQETVHEIHQKTR
jgi:hypothetical protein